MKRSKVLATAVLTGALVAALAAPASADAIPQPKDIVGAGSDTTQFAMNYVADGVVSGGLFVPGYNAAATARLFSYDAMRDITGSYKIGNVTSTGTVQMVHDQIQLKAGTSLVTRPNGSGEGKALLYGSSNNASLNFARSSSALNQAEIDGGVWLVPFAKDGIELAVRKAGSNAPATISAADMVKIYNGTYTNWSQLGGTDGVIKAMIPQNGSGTRSTFEAQLKAANGGTVVSLRTDVVEVQEHDADPIAADANAVAPFSTGRAGLAANANLVKLVEGAGSWKYTRALYNAVRSADRTKGWFTSLFGQDGFVCSGAATALIEASGFEQLAVEGDGGVCGIPTQAATTNFTVN